MVGLRDTGKVAKGKTANTVVNSSFRTALNLYEMENGNFPTTEQGLKALIEKPTGEPAPKSWRRYWDGKNIPSDPWNKDYIYVCPGVHNTDSYDLSSSGQDGKPETEDDIKNW
jgi:general secretion pathway protein G